MRGACTYVPGPYIGRPWTGGGSRGGGPNLLTGGGGEGESPIVQCMAIFWGTAYHTMASRLYMHRPTSTFTQQGGLNFRWFEWRSSHILCMRGLNIRGFDRTPRTPPPPPPPAYGPECVVYCTCMRYAHAAHSRDRARNGDVSVMYACRHAHAAADDVIHEGNHMTVQAHSRVDDATKTPIRIYLDSCWVLLFFLRHFSLHPRAVVMASFFGWKRKSPEELLRQNQRALTKVLC